MSSFDGINVNVFFNNFKSHEKQPDLTGKFELEGKEYQVALWERKDKNGKIFYSQKISLKPDNVNEKGGNAENGDADPFGF